MEIVVLLLDVYSYILRKIGVSTEVEPSDCESCVRKEVPSEDMQTLHRKDPAGSHPGPRCNHKS